MGNPRLEEIAGEVPALVKAGIRGLADDDRLGLALALIDGGRMTFAEMKERFGLDSSTLSNHLTALQKGDLIRNYYEKSGGRAYSYYEATELPKVMLGALFISTGKMKVVENKPIRTRAHDPWTNGYGAGTSPLDQQMECTARTPRRPPPKKRPSMDPIFNNTTEGALYGNGACRLRNSAGRKRAVIQGFSNEWGSARG